MCGQTSYPLFYQWTKFLVQLLSEKALHQLPNTPAIWSTVSHRYCLVFSASKLSSTATTDPSGVAQGIPTAMEDDSIASLDEEDPIPTAMPAYHAPAPMDHEEMFKGKWMMKQYCRTASAC